MANPYQDLIFTHAKTPRGYGLILPDGRSATVENSLCGDSVTMTLAWTASGASLAFKSAGCSLCRASASILIATVTDWSEPQLQAIVPAFIAQYQTMTGDATLADAAPLRALYDLQRFPSRTRCVLLPWDALSKLLYT